MWVLVDCLTTMVLTLLAALVGLLYWYSTCTFDYWKKKGVPYARPVPLLGNVKDTILQKRNFFLVHQDLYNQFEGHRFVGMFMARKPTLLLRDPELIKAILVKDFQHFHDRDLVIHPEKFPLQQHLFSLSGYKWRILRQKLSPTFSSGKMKNMFPLVQECSDKLVSLLQTSADGREIVEMRDILAKFTTDVIGTCAFGLQMNALDDPDSLFRRMGRKVFEVSFFNRIALLINIMLPDLSKWLPSDGLGSEVTEFFMDVFKNTVDYRVKNNIKRNDFLQLLINLRDKGNIDDAEEEQIKEKNGERVIDKNVIDFDFDDGLLAAQAFLFFLAGFETSSSAMSFALHELAVNPDIQSKLREEIDATLKETAGQFTYESVMTMKYLDKVVSETLRKFSPVQLLRRAVTQPYTIPETTVTLDQGTSVVVPIFALHRDPQHFPHPDRFDPERFSEEVKAKRHNYVYLPFGEGPRNCIGMRFGLLQTKLGLAALLSKFEFHVCEQTPIPLQLSPKTLVLSSISGTVVRITNRS